MATLEDVLARAHVVTLPMNVRFRGVDTREAVLIDGPAGWGEFAPFLEYQPAEAAAWLASALESAYVGLPPAPSDYVEVNATIPAVPPEKVAEILERFPGCRVVKVKVAEPGQCLKDDAARVAAVRTARPDAVVRVDANRGWSVPETLMAAKMLGELEYFEQPCATLTELAQLRSQGMPVAADESIRRAADPFVVAREGAADVGVLKVAPLGGVRRVRTVAEFLRTHDMGITIASALDTAVGMNAGLAAAAIVGGGAAGLATQQLFAVDVAPPRAISGGMMSTAPVAPSADRLAELAAPANRRDWWFDRVRSAWPYLQHPFSSYEDRKGN